ncbi:MAG: acetylornithine deacetylase [Pseudomonadota bacterium]|nr:acetylornithine deacetylase [Pseudomonadota bacterium]|tara:strand:+ start:529 stop:1698 length:1170 start_codon:yes stop_codon:yes gene_type:complete
MAATHLDPLALMTKLISFPTVSRDSNLPLVDWVESYLDSHGIPAHRVYDETGEKAALFAHVGPDVEGGIVLSGHTDVVPVDGQAWDTDPWTVIEKDGKYFGRGTCDMKGFDALSIWALVEAHHRGVTRPLQLALSYDEEVGCLGAPPMIDRMVETLPKASAVIVGEPSMMNAVTAHKGGLGLNTRIKGYEVHSSLMHTGVSAIMYGARLIEWANQTNAASAAAEPSPVAAMFEPTFTTVHIGTIEGGTADNITAKDCRFSVDMRVLPDESPERWREIYMEQVAGVVADMKAVHPDTAIEVDTTFWVPGLRPEEDGEAERIVRQITGDNGEHVVSYGTEAGQFQERDYSVVICGPGSIEQAHQPNEFIEVAQFKAGAAFLERMLDTMGRA